MKITDVTVTLFRWENIPATSYSPLSGKIGGESDLGLITISTDEGIEGHAFLGSSSQAASLDANSLKVLCHFIVHQIHKIVKVFGWHSRINNHLCQLRT